VSDEKGHWAQADAPPFEGAPDGVKPISLEGLNYIGVNNDGDLYWRDTRVMTHKKEFRLSFWQTVGAVFTIIAAIVGAGSAAVSAYVDYAGMQNEAR
jgi:hypothetical protein